MLCLNPKKQKQTLEDICEARQRVCRHKTSQMREAEFESSSIWFQMPCSSCYPRVLAMMIIRWTTQDWEKRLAIKQEMWPRVDTILNQKPSKKNCQPQVYFTRNCPPGLNFSSLSGTACHHPKWLWEQLTSSLWKWKCKQVCLHRWHPGTGSVPRS